MNEHMNEKISRRNEICSDLSWPYVKDVNPIESISFKDWFQPIWDEFQS